MEIRLARFSVQPVDNVQPEAAVFINDPNGMWVLAVDALELVKYIRRLERRLRDCHEPEGDSDATSS